jgi:hypothetical protein
MLRQSSQAQLRLGQMVGTPRRLVDYPASVGARSIRSGRISRRTGQLVNHQHDLLGFWLGKWRAWVGR